MFHLPRQSSQLILSQAEYVQVDEDAAKQLAYFLTDQISQNEYDIKKWKSDNRLHPQSMSAESIDWIFLIDSLNFSFWPDAGKEFTIQNEVGYWALCAAIKQAQQINIPITDAKFYSKLTIEDAERIFKTDNANISIPMIKERVDILHQNGNILIEKFGGSFVNCVKMCNCSAVNLLHIIYLNFPSFRDESIYKGEKVTFLKRAQILIADIWGCFEGNGLGTFEDIDQLTMFADYRIPQILHYFDVLKYSPCLVDRLTESALLENGSNFEVEIRGASIYAVEVIKNKMKEIVENSSTSNVADYSLPNSIQIDFYLWGYRRDFSKQIDQKSPFHKVRCIFY